MTRPQSPHPTSTRIPSPHARTAGPSPRALVVAGWAAWLLVSLAASGLVAQPEVGPDGRATLDSVSLDEEYHYRWSLGGLAGVIGRLFLPGHGEGVLTYRLEDGRLQSELLVTSEKSDKGEFWQYGSAIDPRTGDSLEAWSAYRWRGKEKSRRQDVEVTGVKDIVAGILHLRHDPPDGPRPMEIWSDGKIYPVVVIPKKREERKIGDREVMTRRYSIEGLDVEDARRWKGSMELWLAEDEGATPVEIRLERSLASLHLRLVEMP